jgi:hypothetical protein
MADRLIGLTAAPSDSLDEVAEIAGRKALPIKLRIQPNLYRYDDGDGEAGSYVGWRGQVWQFETESAPAMRQLRNALDVFFRAVGSGKVREVEEACRIVLVGTEKEEG